MRVSVSPQRRYAKRYLDQLLEVVPRVIAGTGRVRQFGEMLANRILDHRLIGGHDEGGNGR